MNDAKNFGIYEKGHVKITSRRGTVYLKAKISDAVQPGTVFTSVHFPHGRVNSLTYPSENGAACTHAVGIEAVKA